jgi:hypothetical protein
MKRDAACLLIVTLAATSCQNQPAPAVATSPDSAATALVRPDVRTQLDSANAAFAAQDYPRALRHYHGVTRLDPALSAGWFGVYMAESKLGNQAAADSAIARAREASNR